ncbi:cyclase family protein [Actinoallomurus iriomotensis]|uniref:Cyclase n=1 Tax=Actinoallomurus iriomotensis TaxID=478107 RepID=A0A9W6RZ84_9ACTN|nr:cyclase family protein [Actinoallomurus iriomotensis]GLY84363.1 cyclase [Actinoallomurus iriomotensis]
MTDSSTATAPPMIEGGHVLVDLSVLIAEDLPCYWSTHQPFQHKTWNWFESRSEPSGCVINRSGPYATRWMAIDEHTGTHLDAPSHFIPPEGSGLPYAGPAGAVSIDRVPLDRPMGPAGVVDVSALVGTVDEPGRSPIIDARMITDWEEENGRFRPGDVCLFRTGWDVYYQRGEAGSAYLHDIVVTGRRPAWPAPEVETIELLLERGVRCVGIDAPSMGPAHDDRGQAVHVSGLSGGAVYVECLTGLDRLPERGAFFCFLPLNVERATGAPGRAVAWLPAG